MRRCLLQQSYCLAVCVGGARVESLALKKRFGAQVTVVCHQIGGGRLLDSCFFRWRKLGLKLLGYGFGYICLNGEDIIERPIVDLRPLVRIGAGIDQLRVDAHFAARALHAAFE